MSPPAHSPDTPHPTDPLDEATLRVSRSGVAAADEATAVSGRRGGSLAPGSGAVPADPATTASEDPGPGPRRAQPADPDTDPAGDEGSTVVARRESRRRQERGSAARPVRDDQLDEGETPGPAAPPIDRLAQGPEAMPAIQPVRSPVPVVAARTPPSTRAAQPLADTAAAEASRRRRSRRTAALVVVTASVLALVAAAALILLITSG